MGELLRGVSTLGESILGDKMGKEIENDFAYSFKKSKSRGLRCNALKIP